MLLVNASEAMSLTLRDIVELPKILQKQGLSYVILGEFQSDKIEEEFGIYRKRTVGNYFLSADRVLNGLRLLRLKLFKTLLFESLNEHVGHSCFKES